MVHRLLYRIQYIFGLVAVLLLGLSPRTMLSQPFTNGQAAEYVYGQHGSFTSAAENSGGTSASSLSSAVSVTVDGRGRLYVADWKNNRVLRYDNPLTSDIADAVYGQGGSFTSNDSNHSGLSARSLYRPTDVLIDAAGRMYIADGGNNRVLRFDDPDHNDVATAVYGQLDFTHNLFNRPEGESAATLIYPIRIALDTAGALYVADYGNHRILRFSSPLTSSVADKVFGQPDFSTNDANSSGVTASSLYYPYGIVFDRSNRMYVADAQNNRVLRFDSPQLNSSANAVYGQPDFTSNIAATTRSKLAAPGCVTLDGQGRLYVSDDGNHRVLIYNDPLTSNLPDRVLGQADYTTYAGTVASADRLLFPQSVVADNTRGKVYVADTGHNRVLRYATVGGVPLLGIDQTSDGNSVIIEDVVTGKDGVSVVRFWLRKGSRVHIQVFDALGGACSSEYETQLEYGTYSMSLPVLPSGPYFCRVVINGTVSTKPFLVLN